MITRRCIFLFLALALCGIAGAWAEEKEWASGDGRFALRRQNDNNDFALVEVSSGKPVMGTEELVHSADGSAATVWAKDSTHVAVNFRSGGKYEATQLYAWKGERFEPMADITDELTARVEAERATQMKRLKLPPKTSLRSIFETYRVLRWVNEQTLEVYVRSEQEYVKSRTQEGPDVTELDSLVVTGVYTVRFNKKGEPKIVDRRKPTKKESEG